MRRAVTEMQDGSFLVEYDANRSGYYDFKILLDGLDIGPNGCVTTFDGNPQACTISKGERGMDIVAPGHSSVERERYFSECEAQNAEQNWTACEAWLDPGIQCGADHGVAECASCQATGGSPATGVHHPGPRSLRQCAAAGRRRHQRRCGAQHHRL